MEPREEQGQDAHPDAARSPSAQAAASSSAAGMRDMHSQKVASGKGALGVASKNQVW